MDEFKDKYIGTEERSIYDDPCLTCKNNEKGKDCCCKEWSEYENAKLDRARDGDFTQ